eukprot:1709463-Prorocentrum_lima.AAC.1
MPFSCGWTVAHSLAIASADSVVQLVLAPVRVRRASRHHTPMQHRGTNLFLPGCPICISSYTFVHPAAIAG